MLATPTRPVTSSLEPRTLFQLEGEALDTEGCILS